MEFFSAKRQFCRHCADDTIMTCIKVSTENLIVERLFPYDNYQRELFLVSGYERLGTVFSSSLEQCHHSANLFEGSGDRMLNKMWFGMVVAAFLCAVMTGHIEELSSAAATGADKSIQLLLSMAGVMCLWSGMMKIAEQSGLTRGMAQVLSPLLCRLMPDYAKESRAMQAVCANVTANIFGLGNAATPLGILAMKEMQKENRSLRTPNRSMTMFVVLNTASVQLMPTTIAALRQAAGSETPYAILVPVWLSSIGALTVGILLVTCLTSRMGVVRTKTGTKKVRSRTT